MTDRLPLESLKPHTCYYRDRDTFTEVGSERKALPIYRTDAEGTIIVHDGNMKSFTIPTGVTEER